MSAAPVIVPELKPETQPETQPEFSVCEHVKDDVRRCGSPALRGRHFCYHHSRAHAPSRLGTRHYRASIPETIESLQILVFNVTEALGSGRITDRTAAKFLYAIQVSTNLLKMQQEASKIPGRKPVTDSRGPAATEAEGAPFKPSVGGVVEQTTDSSSGSRSSDDQITRSSDVITDVVTDVSPAMEKFLNREPEPREEEHFSTRDDDDPEMPSTVEEAEKALLNPKQVVGHYKVLNNCDRLSSRYRRLERRLNIHNHAYAMLEENGMLPPGYLEEFSYLERKK